MKRPILYALIPFCLGIIFAHAFKIPIIYALVSAAIFIAVGIVFFRRRTILHTALFMAIFFTSAALLINSNVIALNHILNFLPKDEQFSKVIVKGVVADDPVNTATIYKTIKTSFTLSADKLKTGSSWTRVSGLIKTDIFSFNYKQISFGDEIILEGTISKPHGLSNPGLFNYAEYLGIKNIYCCLGVNRGGAINVLHGAAVSLEVPYNILENVKSISYKVRRGMLARIDEYFTMPYSGFLKAVLVGDKTSLKDSVQDDFIKTGTVHVIAVSGLQVALIAAVFLAIFALLKMPKKINLALTTVLLVFYAFISGANPPIIRSVIMFAVCSAGYLINRKTDTLNSLSFAALAILIFNPKELYDPSFQLSFISIASTMIFSPKLEAIFSNFTLHKRTRNIWSSMRKYIITGVSVSIAAWIGSFPIIAAYFNIFSPVSIIANLIVIPALFLLVAASFVFFAATFVSTFAASIIAQGLQLIEKMLFLINGYMANIPLAFFRVAKPSHMFSFLYYSAIALFVIPKEFKIKGLRFTRLRIAIVIFLALNFFVWADALSGNTRELKLTAIDVGQGDSIFVEFPGAGNMLVDGGPVGEEDKFDIGESVLAPFLWNRNIATIDMVVVTHFHSDHLGGLIYVLQNFNVGCVVDNGTLNPEGEKVYEEYLRIIKDKHIRRVIVREGDMIKAFRDTDIFVLNPERNNTLLDSNDNSLVLKLVYKNFKVLLCGDIKDKAMSRLLTYENFLESDVLKVPHHGGFLGNNEVVADFFGFVSPKISLISVGAGNKYGMPSGRTIAILNNLHSKTCPTKDSGAIEIYSNFKMNTGKPKTANKN